MSDHTDGLDAAPRDQRRAILDAVSAAWPVKIGDDGRTYVCAYCAAVDRGDRTRHSASCPVSQARRALEEAAMAIVTDGLDAATLARWRARLVALRGEMAAVWDRGQPGGRAAYLAWSGVGNATVVLEDALAQLDRAAIELANDAGEEGGDGR